MTSKRESSERGQVVVLVALAIVVLLGFTALAVDGSMVYSDRRYAQNGSDAASLAGGSDAAITLENAYVNYSNWNCGSSDINVAMAAARAAAISRAGDNDFVINESIGDAYNPGVDEGGVTTNCVVDTSGAWDDKYIDVTTEVLMRTNTSFAHFVFGGEMLNTVEAVTRVRPRTPLTFGHAIVALNPANCQGQQNGAGFHGTAQVNVNGGGIWSNGCLQGDGTPDINVTNGDISYVGEFIPGGSFSPAPAQAPEVLPPEVYSVPPPDCGHVDAHNWTANQFESGSPLAPGLYCITGDVSLNGGTHIAHEVTIYLIDGRLRINGNVEINWTAPLDFPDPAPALPGMLLMAPETNHNELQFNGTSDSYFEGTVLAPGSDINVLGNNNSTAYKAQFIGWNVEAGGTGDLNVDFTGGEEYAKPTSLELAR